MKNIKVSFDTWIQLLGMLGILGGLVFVGLEMRQTQIIALAGQVQARNDNIADALIAPMEGQIDAIAHRTIPFDQQTENQKLLSTQFSRWQAQMYENNFYQYQLGLLSGEHWQQQEVRILNAWSDCGFRFLYSNRLNSFMDYLQSLPDHCPE